MDNAAPIATECSRHMVPQVRSAKRLPWRQRSASSHRASRPRTHSPPPLSRPSSRPPLPVQLRYMRPPQPAVAACHPVAWHPCNPTALRGLAGGSHVAPPLRLGPVPHEAPPPQWAGDPRRNMQRTPAAHVALQVARAAARRPSAPPCELGTYTRWDTSVSRCAAHFLPLPLDFLRAAAIAASALACASCSALILAFSPSLIVWMLVVAFASTRAAPVAEP